MKLADYIDRLGITDGEFARELGISQGQLSKLRHGKHWPNRDTVQRIVEVTGGKVMPNDLLSSLNPNEVA